MTHLNPAAPCQTVGIEIELLAPPGSSRKQLAEHIATRLGGAVKPVFHLDSEPSKVTGKPVFYHLTQGFEVVNAQGQTVCTCIDDITLQRDLDKTVQPQPGWYRIVSDDVRLLRLLLRHTDAAVPLADSLVALGQLFGTEPLATQQGVYRLVDESQASLALAAPLPGERERACEIVTAPLAADDRTTLPLLLGCARELRFTLPNEGATHLHFDGAPFCTAGMLADTMELLHTQRKSLRELLQTNLYCRRLGGWPDELMATIRAEDFRRLDWETARQRLNQTKLSKYCDFNIRNLALDIANKHTLEVRLLPATLEAEMVFAACAAFQALFAHLLSQQPPGNNGPINPEQLPAAVVAALTQPTNDLAEPVSAFR